MEQSGSQRRGFQPIAAELQVGTVRLKRITLDQHFPERFAKLCQKAANVAANNYITVEGHAQIIDCYSKVRKVFIPCRLQSYIAGAQPVKE